MNSNYRMPSDEAMERDMVRFYIRKLRGAGCTVKPFKFYECFFWSTRYKVRDAGRKNMNIFGKDDLDLACRMYIG